MNETAPPKKAARMALFPLSAVLMPHAQMRLRLFEPRYLRLVRDCLREQLSFGVVRIRRGAETLRGPRDRLQPPELEALGTSARLIDWEPVPGAEGQLHILIEGGQKFRHSDPRYERDMRLTAHADYLSDEPPDTRHRALSQLRALLDSLPKPRLATATMSATTSPQPAPALQLGYQLAQYLPLPETARYRLLALECATERLAAIEELLRDVGAIN